MVTYNNIIKEMKNIPVDRLKEAYQLIRALNPEKKRYSKEAARRKILSFAGAFADMSSTDYEEFLEQIRNTRTKLFDRNVDL